jgi:hypothetical protein
MINGCHGSYYCTLTLIAPSSEVMYNKKIEKKWIVNFKLEHGH